MLLRAGVQLAYAVHMLCEAHCRHRSTPQCADGGTNVLKLRKMHSLLPGALGWLGAEVGESEAAPQRKIPCSCLCLIWRK